MNIFKTGWSDGFDGPGRRWMLYLKGCNFRCRWCANPEGISPAGEMLFYPQRAPHPERTCPYGAVSAALALDLQRCAACADRPCLKVWRHPAFDWAGEEATPAAIEAQALRYRPLFGAEGGVTFGGGEPTLQADELLDALDRLRRIDVHTAVETNAGTPTFRQLIGRADLLICDLKSAESAKHREWTGHDNAIVLENLSEAAQTQRDLWVRIPLVPGFNDTEPAMNALAAALASAFYARPASMPDVRVEILRLHHLGHPKYAALGQPYAMAQVAEPAIEVATALANILRNHGINAEVA